MLKSGNPRRASSSFFPPPFPTLFNWPGGETVNFCPSSYSLSPFPIHCVASIAFCRCILQIIPHPPPTPSSSSIVYKTTARCIERLNGWESSFIHISALYLYSAQGTQVVPSIVERVAIEESSCRRRKKGNPLEPGEQNWP